jgi:hypothetical protein
MILRRRSVRLVVGIACLLLSKPVLGQSVDSSFSDLVRKQKIIFVVDANGMEFVGRLLQVEPSSLTISTSDGEKSFARERVSELYRRGDSVASGAKIGAVVGAILGALATKDRGCGALLSPYKSCSVQIYAGNMAIIGGLGAGIGVGIDALFRGRTQIYPGKRESVWPTVTVVPDGGLRHASIATSMRW